jgi:hypothetical protein
LKCNKKETRGATSEKWIINKKKGKHTHQAMCVCVRGFEKAKGRPPKFVQSQESIKKLGLHDEIGA